MEPESTAVDRTRTGLADRLKTATWPLHREAERSGLLGDLLRGRCDRRGYVLMLRNLLPVYEALEAGLGALPGAASTAVLAQPAVYRAAALQADLQALAGASWPGMAVLAPARAYAGRIARAAEQDEALLLAHAYVRYLGDLNGGQILGRSVGKALGLGPEQLSFYAFPAIPDLEAFALAYRDAIDGIILVPDLAERVVAEAEDAFRLNIDLFEALGRDAQQRSGPGEPSLPAA